MKPFALTAVLALSLLSPPVRGGEAVVATELAAYASVGPATVAAQAEPARDENGALMHEGQLPLASVRVGDCFDDPTEAERKASITSLRAVPCHRPHDNETYDVFDLPLGDYPGDREVDSLASQGCLRSFEGYMAASYDESQLEIVHVGPDEEAWNDGFRKVICAVYLPPAEKMTRSVRGQGFFLEGATRSTDLGTGAVVVLVAIALAVFVLLTAALWKIFTKAGEAGWKVLIPVWNLLVLLRIAGRPWWWMLLLFVPFVNFVVVVVVYIDLAKAFGKGVGFALGLLFLGMVFLPILAFGEAGYQGRRRPTSSPSDVAS